MRVLRVVREEELPFQLVEPVGREAERVQLAQVVAVKRVFGDGGCVL